MSRKSSATRLGEDVVSFWYVSDRGTGLGNNFVKRNCGPGQRTLDARASFVHYRIRGPHRYSPAWHLYGTYVVAAYDPHEASPDRGFAPIAGADGKMLSWTMGRDHVEITSNTNILTRSRKGELWVYHDPHYQPEVIGLQSADTAN